MEKEKRKFLSATQVAKKLDVSIETVYNMLRDGRLGGRYSKGQGKTKGSWLISAESIELFEENTEIKSVYQIKKENSQQTLF